MVPIIPVHIFNNSSLFDLAKLRKDKAIEIKPSISVCFQVQKLSMSSFKKLSPYELLLIIAKALVEFNYDLKEMN